MKFRIGLAMSGLVLIPACASVPDDAPTEFFQAEQALERADDNDVDDFLPATIERAEAAFDEALDLLDQADDGDVTPENALALKTNAINKAKTAATLATEANSLHRQMLAWDQNIEQYQATASTSEDLRSIREQLAQLATRPEPQAAPPAVASSNLNLKGPVAFFDSGRAELKGRYLDEVNGLADAMTKDKSLSVRLVGYADPSGNPSRNDDLARQRAESVAAFLRSRGISSERIQVEGRGSSSAVASNRGGKGAMQLERRVEAVLQSGSATDVAH